MTTTEDRTVAAGAPPPAAPAHEVGAALDGVLAGGLTLTVATLLAAVMTWTGFAGGTPSPVPAVGGAFVDRTPLWLKNFAVSAFGTNDKLALFAGMGLVLLLVCAAIGWRGLTRHTAGLVVFALVGAVGALAVLSRPNSAPFDVLPTLVGTGVGLQVLRRHWDAAERRVGNLTRRRALVFLGAAVGAVVGTRLGQGTGTANEARADIALPTPGTPPPDVSAAQLPVPGISPFVVPNKDFYRIDTALVVPRLDVASWKLRVHGLVEQELTLDWATLLGKPMQRKLVTLTCVSNEVGGDLVGNALWTGWPVRELLAMARPRAGADMVLSRSSDGFTAGTPIGALTDDRDALLAVAMNGEPLPFEHGFPVRLVVPGLYGYVSATKWLTELKVTTFAADQGYWTPRGWSARGPIKTQSRIDVPRIGDHVKAGTVAVAGVAWAQHRGITGVEVQVDEGPWQGARLAAEPTTDAWRQWVLEWAATPGSHNLRVRAKDSTGQFQVAAEAPPAPDGATGYHQIVVNVD